MAQPVAEIKKAVESIIYRIERSESHDNVFCVKLKYPKNLTVTKLVLRGDPSKSQVQNVRCDGRLVHIEKPGIWSIPEHCQNITWEILIQESDKIPLSDGKSVRFSNSFLLSEGSSLPRLQNVSIPEYVKITVPEIKSIFPALNDEGLIPLSDPKSGWLFVLLNYSIVNSITSDNIKMNFLLDNPQARSKLPDINIVMKGLQWLNTIISNTKTMEFTIGWLGLTLKNMSVTGVAGRDVMLTNYPSDGELPLGTTALIYTALHEACHILFANHGERPTWAEESLASYFGLRALQMALPDNPFVHALKERFLASGKAFTRDLITINGNIENNDFSEYGAFYTKGIAFWLAVDKLLQDKGDSLDKRLPTLLKLKYEKDGFPIDLYKTLNFSKEAFEHLKATFLCDTSTPSLLVFAMHLKTPSTHYDSRIKWGNVRVHPDSFISEVITKGIGFKSYFMKYRLTIKSIV